MTATDALRAKVKKYVDNADEKALLVVEKILEKNLDDWWESLPRQVKSSVTKAIQEIDEGKGISHEQVMKMYPQWFGK